MPRKPPQGGAPSAEGRGAIARLGRPTPQPVDNAALLDVAFEVARVEIRSADVRDALKIWNHVDESRLDPAVAVRLARNGIRMGVGAPASWPAIRAVLEATDATVRKDDLAPQRGLPLAIGLDKASGGETIFTYSRDDRLTGRTFDGGEKVVNVDYFLIPDREGSTELAMTFEIRRDFGAMTWERREETIEEVPAIDRHMFEEATARVTLAPDEFLLVGAAAEAANRYLLGPRFLTGERNGQRYDALLFLTPRTIRSQSVSRTKP